MFFFLLNLPQFEDNFKFLRNILHNNVLFKISQHPT